METPSIPLVLAALSLLAAVISGLHLQFARHPLRFAQTGFGMGVGVALIALGAVIV